MKGRVLIIAGSDPSGGAGIQADIKTVTALGGYAMTAITALTVQNTLGVSNVMAVPPDFIRQQINACLDDIGADAIKIGMIGQVDAAQAIYNGLRASAGSIPIILDPVLIATSGDSLADGGVAKLIFDKLMCLPNVIATPNVPELQTLTGMPINSNTDLLAAGKRLAKQTGARLVLKGGHLTGSVITDILLDGDVSEQFDHPRLATTSTHGTGCTLASALATRIAQGKTLRDALTDAIGYVEGAIAAAPGYGKGHGPLNHGWRIEI